ncbi:signal recognition particle protein [Alphaproteobacteria bacterium]|nr:signal recognition particle protein [Alphaproteobacteria bacterium]
MFDALQGKLSETFSNLSRRGSLKEKDVDNALREVRVALLEADVSLDIVKEFIASIRKKAIGIEILQSISPAQMVIKTVHDHLIETLGSENEPININTNPPSIILIAGLQGSGKTTTAAKLALRFKKKENKKVILASLDVYRPAAQEQLEVLGNQIDVATLPVVKGQLPNEIAKRALKASSLQGADVLILDSAGRTHVDESLMNEIANIHEITAPSETLLVADSLTGQDAINVAKSFKKRIDITGIALTRIDGDARGGAALSMRSATNCPLKLLGTGEKLEDLEDFHPDRIASRILGMGDVVSLVEKAKEEIDQKEAEKIEEKIFKGQFDLDDLRSQFKQMRKMGGMSGLLTMLPGVAKAKAKMNAANLDENILIRQESIISSMTKQERKQVKVFNASRKRRVAAGAGVDIQEVNRVLKQFKQMSLVMKKVKKMSKNGKTLTPESLKNFIPPKTFH